MSTDKKNYPPKFCEICGHIFTPRLKIQTICSNPECKRIKNNLRIKNSYKLKRLEQKKAYRECPKSNYTEECYFTVEFSKTQDGWYWRAQHKNGKQIHNGPFPTIIQAKKDYEEAVH